MLFTFNKLMKTVRGPECNALSVRCDTQIEENSFLLVFFPPIKLKQLIYVDVYVCFRVSDCVHCGRANAKQIVVPFFFNALVCYAARINRVTRDTCFGMTLLFLLETTRTQVIKLMHAPFT